MKLPSLEVDWAKEAALTIDGESYPLEGWRGAVIALLALPALVVLLLSLVIVWASMAVAFLVYVLSLPAVFAARRLYR